MTKAFLLAGLGGMIGSMLRYAVGIGFSKIVKLDFPWGTFTVNLIGCLLIGLVFGFSEKQNWLNDHWRIFLTIGFCGGFTTFSSFAYENISMLQHQNYSGFFLYTIGSVLIGLLAVWAGLLISKI